MDLIHNCSKVDQCSLQSVNATKPFITFTRGPIDIGL